MSDFEQEGFLGVGGFGYVLKVRTVFNGFPYAVKALSKKSRATVASAVHEKKYLQQVDSSFQVKLYATFQDANNLYLLMEFIEGNDLRHLMRGYK